MKLCRFVSQFINRAIPCQRQSCQAIRALSTNSPFGGESTNPSSGSVEPDDDFERRIFGGRAEDSASSFFKKFDKITSRNSGVDSIFGGGSVFGKLDFSDEGFNSLEDGMDDELKKAAQYFEVDADQVEDDPDFSFRPDMNLHPGMTYRPEDLDLRKPGIWKPSQQNEFQVTTKEVLERADFRNVRFLANFLTEAGIIIKRSKTGISAKAQRKVAREIKTARAFGLMPFTAMGTKAFVVGKSMENLDQDYDFTSYSPAMPEETTPVDPLEE